MSDETWTPGSPPYSAWPSRVIHPELPQYLGRTVAGDSLLKDAFRDLALAAAGESVLTQNQPSTTASGVVTSTSPLQVRVGIAATPTTCRIELPGYIPVVGQVVTVTRQGRRQSITGVAETS